MSSSIALRLILKCDVEFRPPVELESIAGMHKATRLDPLTVGDFVLRITPEDGRLLRRGALAEELIGAELFSLSRALLRRPKHNGELLILLVDDFGPRFTGVSMKLLRRIFVNSAGVVKGRAQSNGT